MRIKDIIKEFEKEYSVTAERVEKYERIGPYEIKGIFTNGKEVWYDCMEHAINLHHSIHSVGDISPDDESEEAWLKMFSDRLINRMNLVGCTQSRLAERTGISQPLINRYIRGTSVPSARNIRKIAKELECSTDDLINY